MNHNRPFRVTVPFRRLLRARPLRVQLRLKIMAGVVALTLIALTAFDIAAVTTMRHYLYGSTDKNLQAALNFTRGQLPFLVKGYPSGGGQAQVQRRTGPPPHLEWSSAPPRSVFGGFTIVYLPSHGKQIPLQVDAGAPPYFVHLSPGAAKVAAMPGPHNAVVVVPGGLAQMRLQGMTVKGGSLVAGTSLDQVTNTVVQIELIVMFGSIAMVLLIGLGVFAVLRRGLRPVEAMAAQADRITAGDLAERVTPHNPRSEVGRLGAALNGMLARIETGVHEREASQEQMRRFFADASHELRTPLASLRANAELYQQGALSGQDELDEVMRRITLETRRMGRLVDDMLRLARLGQHPDQGREPVDLTALVSACAERARIADPDRTWRVRVADGLETTGDEELLRRAVDNLLANVLVHTPSTAVGTLTASAEDGAIRVEVGDDGPGVAPDKLPHLFERFYRAGARPARPGSGLGLAIVAEIAAAHGGRAEAASASPHGLRVRLTVPVRQDHAERTGVTPLVPVSSPAG
jgi:two-component system, OmpR family, sensor kinase